MYHKNLSNKLNIRITNDQYNYLCDIAKKRKITTSMLIRYILGEYVRNYK